MKNMGKIISYFVCENVRKLQKKYMYTAGER